MKLLQNYCYQENINEIFYNRQYEINELRRDNKLVGDKVIFKRFDDNVIMSPGRLLNNRRPMYKIYTPFRKAFIHKLVPSELCSLPPPKIRQSDVVVRKVIPSFDYPMQEVDQRFTAGEQAALQRLRTFCREQVNSYMKLRDMPHINGTSFSPRQCINMLRIECPNVLDSTETGAACWWNELIWREFYRHLSVAYPFLCMSRPFIKWTENIRWDNNNQALQAWKQGLTGYPMVDAAMRQLNQTGWIHNRLRMISASFLVKDLLIDWRIGEQYFMSQLLDGDFASNNGGWQWAASTGTDSGPYCRILNPTRQGERLDPQGIFIRQWIPELRDIPDKYIHHPHSWAAKNRYMLNYPLPMVDHKYARKKIIGAFYTAKAYYLKNIHNK